MFTNNSQNNLYGWQGLGGNVCYFPKTWERYIHWTPGTTTTVLQIRFAGGTGTAQLRVQPGYFSSANRTVLVNSGWVYDDKHGEYYLNVSGNTDLSIPPFANASLLNVIYVIARTALNITIAS